MSTYENLISPRSRAPIVLSAEDDDDEDGGAEVRIEEDVGRSRISPRLQSLALPASTAALPLTGPSSSILKGAAGMSGGDVGSDMLGRASAVQSRLEEETSAYKRRLESYRQAQHQQALLVARLQSKLLQYKQRCADLETKLGQSTAQELYLESPPGGGLLDYGPGRGAPGVSGVVSAPADIDDVRWKLDQERARSENLIQLNRELRNELEETRKMNSALSQDLQQLSNDWEKLTKQMSERENLWKAEEQAYTDFYASEHTKLLTLWKKVASAKRDFAELKSSTGRDLAQLKNSIGRISNQISSAVLTAAVTAPTPHKEAEQQAFLAKLTQELTIAQNTQENLRRQLKDRDERIASLEISIQEIDAKTQNLEAELNRVSVQELGLLQNSLREIGKLLLSDFDQHGLEDGHDVHLTSTPAIFIYDENGENPTVFAESIVSAVQAALNKRQAQIHLLQVSLASMKEQSMVTRGHVDELETELAKREEKIAQMTDVNEKLRDALENVKMDRDSAQRTLDALKNEKNILEQQRKALASELDTTLKIKNSLATNLSKLEKVVENSRDEIETLNIELDKTKDELATATSQLKLEQDLNARIREQLASIGDDKERNASENKALKTNLNELVAKYEEVCFQLERSDEALKKWKMDAEILGEKLRAGTERAENIEKEKKKWAERARQAEEDQTRIEAELHDARNDLTSLRRELLESERLRTDLEAKIENLIARADAAENKKSILENQLDSQREEFLREMSLATERVEIITEDLNHTRRELEEALQVLERTKVDLHTAEKMHMEAVHLVESKEAVIKNLSNNLEKLRNEKASLEELEENLKSVLTEKEKKIESMERQAAEEKSKLNNQLASLKDKLTRTENEMRNQKEKADKEKAEIQVSFSKQILTIQTESGSSEEKVKTEYEEKLKTLRSELEGEKRNEVNKLMNEINSLRQQIESLRVQYEEALLRAENDKQQGLLLAQQDQQGLSDKIRLLERELEDTRNDKERLKRECETRCNHEKNASAALRSELIKVKNELETTKQDGIDTMKQIEARLTDIDREREGAIMHIEELRNKLRTAEEKEANLKRELNEVHRKLKDAENSGDSSKKEISELRKTLTEMAVEKEKTNSAMETLKDELNRKENDIAMLKKDLNKTQTKMKDLERLKGDMEAELAALTMKMDSSLREKSDASRQVDDLQDQLTQARALIAKLESENAELKVKLDAETERRDEAEAQWRSTKKLLEDVEGQLNLTKAEEERLTMKLAEAEERYANRENQLLNIAEENKHREKKLMEEKHNLSICLAQVQQQMEQIQNKLGSTENRLKMLSDERNELERQKKDAETKLGQIQSGLKRMGLTSGALDSPDAVRRAMATLQTQMAALQQDRDTVASQLASARDQISNLEMAKASLEDQIATLTRTLQSSRGDTKAKETAIFTLEKELALKTSEINRLADKVREMEDAVKARDDTIKALRADKDALKEELDRARAKFDDTRGHFDSKWSKAEVNMRALEGDLNRLAMVLQQKESHIAALEEKCTSLQRNNSEVEERCASLTMTVEQLNIALEKTSQSEQECKEKCAAMSRNLSESNAQLIQLSEKLRSLQREKTALEQERNALSEKWEAASVAVQDFKRQIQVLADKNQKLRQQTEEMTRNAIDKQLKMALTESGKDDLRQVLAEKLELQRKLDMLMEKVRDLERENRELERFKESVPLKGARPISAIRDNAITVLEEENSELRRKISKLEAEMRDMERRHTKHVAEVSAQIKQERDFELERARAAKLQAERLLEARETNYRQQIQRLEQQVAHLKEQLGEEIRRRQSFLTRSFRTGQEIRTLRQALGDSLRNVAMDPTERTMESETRGLHTALDLHKSASQSSLLSPLRDVSPGLKSSTPLPK